MTTRPLALAIAATAALLVLTGCTPQEGGKCDPKKDSSFFSSHTEDGKTKTVRLECKQTGINKYRWVKQ